jgi:hypothetical protein
MALADVHHLLGLARYSLLDPGGARAGRDRKEQHHSWAGQLRVLEADTAVDLALAACAENAARSSCTNARPRPGEHSSSSASGPRPAAQRTVWAPKP